MYKKLITEQSYISKKEANYQQHIIIKFFQTNIFSIKYIELKQKSCIASYLTC